MTLFRVLGRKNQEWTSGNFFMKTGPIGDPGINSNLSVTSG